MELLEGWDRVFRRWTSSSTACLLISPPLLLVTSTPGPASRSTSHATQYCNKAHLVLGHFLLFHSCHSGPFAMQLGFPALKGLGCNLLGQNLVNMVGVCTI